MYNNMIGKSFGTLIVLNQEYRNMSNKNRLYLYCKCQSCNKIKWIRSDNIITCGCIHSRKSNAKHNEVYKGVSWDSKRNKWIVQITINHKHYYLGRYDNKDKAIEIRKLAEQYKKNNFAKWYLDFKKLIAPE